MRSILLLAAFATFSIHANAQWNLTSDNYTTGKVGIGIQFPTSKLDVRDGTIQMIPNAAHVRTTQLAGIYRF
ncbi:hypothetical protein SAMN04488109_2329 [Chryseolinea serpens]|uniref:Outer membrane protein beta-barrel domain-containing protein n=1 Tax=Chryseolinea serpens TaxID=947013 RepID=A0A1M5NGL1_9BACT|nr:hypothetical protein SAMN04488109_2329 [Chryseolinea serpens]